jgi:hypothetical protein
MAALSIAAAQAAWRRIQGANVKGQRDFLLGGQQISLSADT